LSITITMNYIPSLYTTGKAVAGVFGVGVASTAMLLYRYQRSLIYPSNFPSGSRTEVMTPDEFGMDDFEELTLDTPDGERLHCYAILQRRASNKERLAGLSDRTDQQADTITARRPTVLLLHANAGNMGHRLPLAGVFFKRFGCNIVMLSYRGYGKSTGEPSEQGIRIDAQTALDWIRRHPILSKTVIVAYGQSIGGAVAIDLASRNAKTISAMILENTFLSIPQLIPHVLPPVRPFAFLCREYWPSETSITKLSKTMPTLFISGRQDELVPPSHMDTLFQRCSSTEKVWMEINDGTHNDTCVKPGYFDAIGLFLASYVVSLTSGGQEAAKAAKEALSSRLQIVKWERIDGYCITSRDDQRSPQAFDRNDDKSDGEWIEMKAQDAAQSTSAPTLDVPPQDVASESIPKGRL
jgi:hypothetical protein